MYGYEGFLSGLSAGSMIITMIIYIVEFIVIIGSFVALASIFNKAGEAMWKSVIPVYNMYTLFKISEKTRLFIGYVISLAILLIGLVTFVIKFFSTLFNSAMLFYDYNVGFDGAAMVSIIFVFAGWVGCIVFKIIMKYNLSKAFGHGGGFTVGLVLLEAVFYMILGFGSDEYIYGQSKLIPDGSDSYKNEKTAGYIRCIAGERAKASIIIEEGELVKIGRDPKVATLILDENNDKSKISRLHCEVEYDTHLSVYYVTDYSKNGVSLEDGTKLIAGVRTPVKRGTKLILPKNNVFLLA